MAQEAKRVLSLTKTRHLVAGRGPVMQQLCPFLPWAGLALGLKSTEEHSDAEAERLGVEEVHLGAGGGHSDVEGGHLGAEE
jgi:hypothetical protein